MNDFKLEVTLVKRKMLTSDLSTKNFKKNHQHFKEFG